MNESKVEPQTPAGSFLPKIIPITMLWRRSREMDRNIIEQQLREHIKIANTLVEIRPVP